MAHLPLRRVPAPLYGVIGVWQAVFSMPDAHRMPNGPDVARICQTLSSLLVKNVPGESYGGFSHVSASGCAGRTSNELTASNWHLFLPLSVFLSLHSSFSHCFAWTDGVWDLENLFSQLFEGKKSTPCHSRVPVATFLRNYMILLLAHFVPHSKWNVQ